VERVDHGLHGLTQPGAHSARSDNAEHRANLRRAQNASAPSIARYIQPSTTRRCRRPEPRARAGHAQRHEHDQQATPYGVMIVGNAAARCQPRRRRRRRSGRRGVLAAYRAGRMVTQHYLQGTRNRMIPAVRRARRPKTPHFSGLHSHSRVTAASVPMLALTDRRRGRSRPLEPPVLGPRSWRRTGRLTLSGSPSITNKEGEGSSRGGERGRPGPAE
jgi:hypothetical protein